MVLRKIQMETRETINERKYGRQNKEGKERKMEEKNEENKKDWM